MKYELYKPAVSDAMLKCVQNKKKKMGEVIRGQWLQFQAQVHDIFPPATAIIIYAMGLLGAQMAVGKKLGL